MIEMMFATFVYPMLLQPLLLFYQRFTATVDSSHSFCSENPFGGYSGDYSDAESILAPVAAPAKAALFTISVIFNTLSNHPLLRLMASNNSRRRRNSRYKTAASRTPSFGQEVMIESFPSSLKSQSHLKTIMRQN